MAGLGDTEPITSEKEGVRLRVRVQPRSSRTAIEVQPDGAIRVALSAPPVEGEANAALREAISRALRVAKSSVTVVSGLRSREKSLLVAGVSVSDVRARLGAIARREKGTTK